MDSQISNFYDLGREKGLKIVHLNVRSLFRKLDQIQLILQSKPADIFAITETWLNPKIEDKLLQIKGYTSHRLDRNISEKVRGGGLIIYIRDDKEFDITKHPQTISNKNHEAQWYTIARPHAKNLLLCNIYRPPSGKVAQTIKYLNKTLGELNPRNNAEIYILGDLNIDYKNKKCPNYKKLVFF